MELCVKEARMPRKEFITDFPSNEIKLQNGWKGVNQKETWLMLEKLKEQEEKILKVQGKIGDHFWRCIVRYFGNERN